MWKRFAVLICVAILGTTLPLDNPSAQSVGSTLIEPGSVHVFEQGEGFSQEHSDCGGINICKTDVDLDGRYYRTEAYIAVGALGTTHRGKFTVFNTFTLTPSATPLPSETRLSASISGQVYYEGFLNTNGTFGEAYSEIRIVARVRDLTDNQTIAEQVLLDRACRGSNIIAPDFCIDRPAGTRSFNLVTTLVRGHVYQIDIVGQCKVRTELVGGAVRCNFYEYNDPIQPWIPDAWPGNGVNATPITLSVEEDLKLEVMELREELELLKKVYGDHAHTYKTGPGKGHNSDDALSGTPKNN